MNVLVVDDDVVARMMLMHLVDSCGAHTIVEADDGVDAWRQLETGARPDIVFCDLRMPRLSGLELLQRVRAHPALATLPFVLVSAASDAATRDGAAALGASGYIVKPFRQDDVRAQFERLCPAAAAPDDAPLDVARRLGIDSARLLLYLGGLARQLDAAVHELPGGEAQVARARLARLGEGCATLGLHGAAAALAGVAGAALLDDDAPAAALADASAAVARQLALLAHA